MFDLFERIDTWRRHQGGAILTVAPGATEEEIREAETALGVCLPGDLRYAFVLRNPFWLPLRGETQSIQDVVELWRLYCGVWTTDAWGSFSIPVGPVRPDWWNCRWIPISLDQHCCHFVDFDPAPGGQVGQIVSYDCGDPRVKLIEPTTTVVATCFRQWVEKLVIDLERGSFELPVSERRPE